LRRPSAAKRIAAIDMGAAQARRQRYGAIAAGQGLGRPREPMQDKAAVFCASAMPGSSAVNPIIVVERSGPDRRRGVWQSPAPAGPRCCVDRQHRPWRRIRGRPHRFALLQQCRAGAGVVLRSFGFLDARTPGREAALRQALRLSPDNPAIFTICRAAALAATGQPCGRPREFAAKAYVADPRNIEALLVLADCHTHAGRSDRCARRL